ncbi:hypothetical protein [Bacillus massiliigorillae]|uniref:hypothetical protein n=1 Tax=Bacillus massiliigorillae TaxID=1243664 RepID=UPI0003998049|nr:hypothetical protein [Bacillus massiliigorillae]
MNETELFIEMLEDEDADSILKYFQESLVGTRNTKATLEQKKQHIKKIFKSKTPNMIRRRRKGGADPFYNFLNNYTFTLEKANTFNEQLKLLSELKEDLTPCSRFANLLLEYPNEIREKFQHIEENIKLGKDPLDISDDFQTEEEVKAFFRKFRDFSGEDVPRKIVKVIEKYQPEEYQSKLQKCEKIVECYNLLEYYKNNKRLADEYGLSIVNAAYIRTHEHEDQEVLMLFAIEAMYALLQEKKVHALKQIGLQFIEMKQQLKEEENKWKEKQKEVTELKAEAKNFTKTLRAIEKDKVKMALQLKEMEHQLTEQAENFRNVKKHSDAAIQRITNEIEGKLKDKEQELEFQKFIHSEKMRLFQVEDSYVTDWALICVSDYDLTVELFPELTIVQGEDKKACTTVMNDPAIHTIYINMKGLSTKSFKELRQSIEQHNKVYKPLDFSTYKQLVEWIGYKKTIERQVVFQ